MNGVDPARVRALLTQRYTPIGGQPYPRQVYEAIERRALDALANGARLQRKRNNNPLKIEEHTGSIGLSDEYRYTVVVELQDTLSGRKFTRPFLIDSATALGKWDILAAARVQATHVLMGHQDTLGSAQGMELVITGSMRISDALVRI